MPNARRKPRVPAQPQSAPRPKTTKKPSANAKKAVKVHSIGTGERKMLATTKQLQKKQKKHGADFGVPDNFNQKTEEKFRKALEEHVTDPSTRVIQGTYKQTQKVTHFYNPKTNLNVMRDAKGEFLSGWKLNEKQAMNVATRGSL